MANTYDSGDRINITTSTTFQDSDAVAFDPDVVTFKVKDPAGTVTTYTYDQDGAQDSAITKNGTGDYTLAIDCDTSGAWHYRVSGEQDGGENRGADEGYFEVTTSNVI